MREHLSLHIHADTDSVACEHLSLDRMTLEPMYKRMLSDGKKSLKDQEWMI